jgi:hypothetical protein
MLEPHVSSAEAKLPADPLTQRVLPLRVAVGVPTTLNNSSDGCAQQETIGRIRMVYCLKEIASKRCATFDFLGNWREREREAFHLPICLLHAEQRHLQGTKTIDSGLSLRLKVLYRYRYSSVPDLRRFNTDPDPHHLLTGPDLALFFSGFQDANKKIFSPKISFSYYRYLLYCRYIYISIQRSNLTCYYEVTL